MSHFKTLTSKLPIVIVLIPTYQPQPWLQIRLLNRNTAPHLHKKKKKKKKTRLTSFDKAKQIYTAILNFSKDDLLHQFMTASYGVVSPPPLPSHTTTSLLAQVQKTWLHDGSPPQAWSPNSPEAARTTASHLHAQDCWGANASDTSRCILDSPETKTSDEITQIKLSTDFVSSNQAQNYIRNNGRCYTVPHCNTEQYFFFFFLNKHPITITA